MTERRKITRFNLQLPATLSWMNGEQKEERLDLFTKDVSSNGAFLPTNNTIPVGTPIRLKFKIASDVLSLLTGAQGVVSVAGNVLRSVAEGVAVEFKSRYKFVTEPRKNNSLHPGGPLRRPLDIQFRSG